MRRIIYILVVALLFSCTQEEEKYAAISLKPDDSNPIEFIQVRNPLEDVYLWGMKNDTLYRNENEEFLFKKKIEKPEYIIIGIGDKFLKAVLLPNEKIEIAYADSSYVFKGKNSAGMNLLNQFKRPVFSVSESNKYRSDSTSSQVSQKLNSQREKELSELQKLSDDHQIGEGFNKILKDEIDYFYALRTFQIILSKQNPNTPISEDLLELSKTIEEEHPLDIAYKPSSWLDYAEIALLDKPLYDLLANQTITIDSIQSWYESDEWIPYQYNVIKEYQNPKIAEKVSAFFILNTADQKQFEKSLITVFQDFKETYPTSLYTQYLEPEVRAIEDYHRKISEESSVEFIDGKNISTMKELLEKLEGNKYYVDVWATWCGPCIEEFKHNKELNALLKSKGYKKLYLSIDKPEVENKWRQDIKYYDLKGLHMLASIGFSENFARNYSLLKGKINIPQYLIIDEKGDIITNNAPRPSNLKELEKILVE